MTGPYLAHARTLGKDPRKYPPRGTGDGRVRYDIAKPIRYALSQHAGGARRTGPPGPAMLLTRKLGPRPPFVRTHASNPAFPTGGGGIAPPL